MSHPPTRAFVAFFMFLRVREVVGECYHRNNSGPITTLPSLHAVQNPNNPISKVCCVDWDTCLPNGLCQSTRTGLYWREMCTEENWEDGGCQELCSNERGSQRENNEKVTPCDGTPESITWCCGVDDSCCAEDSQIPRFTIAKRLGDPIPTEISSSYSATSVSTSVSVSASYSSTSSTAIAPTAGAGKDPVSDSLTTGAKAGIGIGAVAGALACIALGIFIVKALHWRKKALAKTEREIPETGDRRPFPAE